MQNIKKIRWITFLILICILISCQVKKPNEPSGPAKLSVHMQMSDGSEQGGLISKIKPVVQFKSITPISPAFSESIEDVQIVFYHFDMTVDELFESYTTYNDELSELAETWEGDVYDFEEFWIGLSREVFDIVAPGKYQIEKQSQLEIDGHHATGEFELSDGVKYCLLGLTGHDQLQYIGESYDSQTESMFFELEPGEEKDVTIYLTYIDWGNFTNYEPNSDFTVTPDSGNVETVFSFDASSSWDHEDAASLLQVRWDWESDGTWDTDYTTTKTETHQYTTAGTYTVTLEVRDTDGMTDQAQDQVVVTDNTQQTGTVTDIDGNIYQTVKIGNQWWMAENLKVTHYRNGDTIPNVTDNTEWSSLTTGACCVYENDDNNASTYGLLYNWYAVNDARNIALTGWHVPTDAEWTTLTTYLGGESVAGGKMKETGTSHWQSPNTGATNESGFSALPGGFRDHSVTYRDVGDGAGFWSSTEGDSSNAWYRSLGYDDSGLYRDDYDKRVGFSVRCTRD